ncbi:cytochrome P450 [Xylariaceae sp. FL1651]|nr:cytochrome P450 [Xylariaceae sp. FL1651]
MFTVSFLNLGVVTLSIVILGICLHRALLPKPIPGIPYKKASARRILGDVVDIAKGQMETNEMWKYVGNLSVELNSPIFQMFMRPLGKPWVVVTDFREAEDILMRRQGEFDRSTFLGEVFGPLLPNNHVWMPSDERFRAHRHLLRDTMSPGFLNGVVAPSIHTAILSLLDLWRLKDRIAKGRPVQVDEDIIRGVVDVVLSVSYGLHVETIKTQINTILSSEEALPSSGGHETPVVFPEAEDPKIYQSVRTLIDSIQIGMSSPVPRQHMKFALGFYPSLVSARRFLDNVVTTQLRATYQKFTTNLNDKDQVNCAMDLLVQAEIELARKEARSLQYDTPVIKDELFGFFTAGHETTSTSLRWALKHLTKFPNIQKKLRDALRLVHSDAARRGELPSPEDIVKNPVPYLDAFIEENHRQAAAIPTLIRMTTKEAYILGHKVPKGTDIFMPVNGPSYLRPGLTVDEDKRSATSQAAKGRHGVWDDKEIGDFKPERFLTTNADGITTFNPRAGPVMPYGAGLRSCFGIKLAKLELTMIITMIVWSFELKPPPAELLSFAAIDKNTHRPQHTYVRLAEVTQW